MSCKVFLGIVLSGETPNCLCKAPFFRGLLAFWIHLSLAKSYRLFFLAAVWILSV
jgi:hypothetical protein